MVQSGYGLFMVLRPDLQTLHVKTCFRDEEVASADKTQDVHAAWVIASTQ